MVKNAFWHICKQIQGTVDDHGAEAKSYERHSVNMCGVTYHDDKLSGEQTDHQHQQITYNHHRMIRDKIKTPEVH